MRGPAPLRSLLLAPPFSLKTRLKALVAPARLTPLHGTDGRQLLAAAEAQASCAALMASLVAQDDPATCGIASMLTVLTALGVPGPGGPGTRLTPDTLLDDRAESILPRATIRQRGMSLAELAQLLALHPVRVAAHHAGDSSLAAFRAAAVAHLAEPGRAVIVNYGRQALGQAGRGHISPRAAYHAGSDHFLVLDVATAKHPPAWVRAADLFFAMDTIPRRAAATTRGFVLVSRYVDAA